MFNMRTACDTAHMKSVLRLLLNMLQLVLGNNLQFNFRARQVVNKKHHRIGDFLMNCHFDQVSFRSCAISIKCRFDQVSYQSSVVSVKCCFGQVLFRSNVVSIKCRFNQVSFQSSVVSIKCHSINCRITVLPQQFDVICIKGYLMFSARKRS